MTNKLPYLEAVEEPLIKLYPNEMRSIVFQRTINLDFDVNLDNYNKHLPVLNALASEHFKKQNGKIKASKIVKYELHLRDVMSQYHKVIPVIVC